MTNAEKRFYNAEKKFNVLKALADEATDTTLFPVFASMQLAALDEMLLATDAMMVELDEMMVELDEM